MNKATLAICILLQRRERNKAISLKQDTQLLRGLSAYVRNISTEDMKETSRRIVRASWLKAMIDEHIALSERLTNHITANIEDANTRNEGVYIMTQLDAYITHLNDELESLWLPS